ncbi:MAG: HAMP domain-containing histidine kinase [Proteobacteria bacterium]|nr:HAMP domain-containing histidine kinase [Pseudomonadota bacterium]
MLKLFSIQYSNKLILEMLKGSLSGSIASNIIGPVIAIIILYDSIPITHLAAWFLCHLLIILFKLYIAPKLKMAMHDQSNDVHKLLSFFIFITSQTAVLYGVIAWLCVIYNISEIKFLIVSMIAITLSAGSIGTLGTVFIAFAAYMLLSIFPLIFALIYHGSMNFYIFALILFVYMIVHTKSGYRLFLSYQRTNEVEQEIIELNTSLESKIKQEVAKNREKDQQMLQQGRLAQMGEMISMIAHQWRQPLAAISSTSAAIKLKSSLNKLDQETAIKLSNNISDYSQHLSSTIDDFREFFKPDNETTKSSFNEVVESVLKIVQISIEQHNIRLIKEMNSQISFTTYPNELMQVILNLIKNSEDNILDKELEDSFICIRSYDTDEQLILEIKDNGGGVPDNIIDKIFDPYFSTKTQKDGTGLGLYMSKIIIEEHCGGKLSVFNYESDGAKGAVFQISLNIQ